MTHSTNDHDLMTGGAKSRRSYKVEYALYFALIFMAVLPICAARWVFRTIVEGKLPQGDPIRWARSKAQAITPCIFWT